MPNQEEVRSGPPIVIKDDEIIAIEDRKTEEPLVIKSQEEAMPDQEEVLAGPPTIVDGGGETELTAGISQWLPNENEGVLVDDGEPGVIAGMSQRVSEEVILDYSRERESVEIAEVA